jgi:hypothetical protein
MRETAILKSRARTDSQPRARRDARKRQRAKLNLPALLWPFEPEFRGEKEVGRVTNFTSDGLYFRTKRNHYFVGMKLLVTFPVSPQAPKLRDYLAAVVRVEDLGKGTFGVAVRFIF